MASRSSISQWAAGSWALPALTLGAALVLPPRVARAEGAKAYAPCARQPSETDIAGAKGAFQAGQASFDEADYRRAIDYWEDAYRRDCTAHALLLNLARAYELNGAKDQAITALRTYLERVPTTPDHEKIQRRIDVLQQKLEDERTATTRPAPAPAPVTPAPTPETSPRAATEPAAIDAQPAPAGRRPLLPLIVAGAGGAIAIVGTIFYIPAYSDLQDVEEQCPDHSNCGRGTSQSLIDRGNDARTRVNVAGAVTIGGLVVLGGGLAWYFLSPRSGGQTSGAEWSPVLAPSYAGVNYAGTF